MHFLEWKCINFTYDSLKFVYKAQLTIFQQNQYDKFVIHLHNKEWKLLLRFQAIQIQLTSDIQGVYGVTCVK